MTSSHMIFELELNFTMNIIQHGNNIDIYNLGSIRSYSAIVRDGEAAFVRRGQIN